MLDFLQNNLLLILLLIPIIALLFIFAFVEYMNLYFNYPNDEWPETSITESDIQAALDDDPNIKDEE